MQRRSKSTRLTNSPPKSKYPATQTELMTPIRSPRSTRSTRQARTVGQGKLTLPQNKTKQLRHLPNQQVTTETTSSRLKTYVSVYYSSSINSPPPLMDKSSTDDLRTNLQNLVASLSGHIYSLTQLLKNRN